MYFSAARRPEKTGKEIIIVYNKNRFDFMKKILIISIISGLGHYKAAQAVEKALKQYPGKVRVKHINILDYLPEFYSMAFKSGYAFLTKNFPKLYSLMYHQTNKYPWPKNYMKQARWLGKHSKKFLSCIRDFAPDIIVSTHYLPTQVIGEYKKRSFVRSRLVAIVTDFNVHAYLMQDNVDVYILPDKSIVRQLRKFGFRNRVMTFGIPADPALKKKIDIEKAKRELGLFPRLKTVLIICSNYKLVLLKKIFKVLNRVKGSFQVIATTGRNTGILKAVNRIRKNYRFPILSIGFTERIYDLMKVPDVIITKPGGLTVAEVLVCGIPMILLNPIPGQEERNADMLVRAGAAYKLKVPEMNKLPAIIEEVLGNEKKSGQIRRNALKLAKPDASRDIAEFLVNL